MGFVEITGTEATISLPDPNYFDGDIRLWRAGDEDWTTIPATGPANGRGMGVLDMARSIRAGVPHRATGRPGLPRPGQHGLDLRVHGFRHVRRRRQLRARVRSPPRGLGPHRLHPLGTATMHPTNHNRTRRAPSGRGHDRLRVHGQGPLECLAERGQLLRRPGLRAAGPGRAGPCRVADAAAKYGWAESATDWRAVIARDDIHIVDICAPGWMHAEIAIAALAAGKHVLVEKPLANTLAEAEAMAEAARAARAEGVQSMVGFNYRRVPALGPGQGADRRGPAGHGPARPCRVPAGLAGRSGNAHDLAAAQGHRRFRGAGRHRLPRHRPGAVPARETGSPRFRPAAHVHLAAARAPAGWKR